MRYSSEESREGRAQAFMQLAATAGIPEHTMELATR